ncbi:MAG: ATP-grasp domain-containing protein, partial [Bacteroidia bacterium]|nr:ATP-grasp domain-containing protein [Bacteroidia bacterium]
NEVFKLRFKQHTIGDHKQDVIYQEKLKGTEFGMDVLNDFKGNYIGSLGRKKLNMRGGETDKAESIIDKDLTDVGARLGNSLKHLGTMDCDIFLTNDKFYVLELNPRFGGGYPFSHEAGCKTCNVYVDWLDNRSDYMRHISYKPGLIFSKCDRMIKVGFSSNKS